MTNETTLTKDESETLTAIRKLRVRPAFSNIAEALGVPRSCEGKLDSVLESLVDKREVYLSGNEYRAVN